MNGDTPLQQYVMYATLLHMVSDIAPEREFQVLARRAREKQVPGTKTPLLRRLRAWATDAFCRKPSATHPATRAGV